MNKKATGIIAYITTLGWVIAFLAGDKEGAKFHLNQALVFVVIDGIIGLVSWIPFVGWIISVALLVFRIMGIVYAAQDQDKELPLIGGFKIMN